MTAATDFFVRFWGVRGSIACPGPDTVRYGGNTTCIEIRCGENFLIIDGGTGLRQFGLSLMKDKPARIDLFFTHVHWDHIAGVPFFVPAYVPDIPVHFWAGSLLPERTLEGVLKDQMMAPLFPVNLETLQNCYYHDFVCGAFWEVRSGIQLSTCSLNHPNGACGYKIVFAGKTICIITDTEHRIGEIDTTIVDFVRNADVMVYDAMYTDESYLNHVGWGHSTWQEALRIGDAAGVRTVVPFHHDPIHNDDVMDRIAAEAEALRPGTLVAREGMIVRP